MWNNSLKTDLLTDEIIDILSSSNEDLNLLHEKLRKLFPSLSKDKIEELSMILSRVYVKNKEEKVEIVSTTPISFKTKNRKTLPVIKQMILSSNQSILLTGYSISDHIDELLELIFLKSKKGVRVDLYLNNYEETKRILNKFTIKGNTFLTIYNYSGIEEDAMSSLHAKTLIVDGYKMLISSANLSFHGMISNIEIGVYIESKSKCIQVLDIFKELKRTNVLKVI